MTEITMTDHVKALKEARAKLVDSRRSPVVQNVIEQIDKAIVVEQKHAPTAPVRVSDYDRRWVEYDQLDPDGP
jgi:hypothetical protein